MNKNLLLFAGIFSFCFANAQESMPVKPFSSVSDITLYEKYLPEELIEAPSLVGVEQEDIERDNNGQFYRIAKHTMVDFNLQNSGTWSTLPNGDKVWRLKMTSLGAQGTLLFFNDFYLPAGSRMHVYSPDKKQLLGAFTSYNNHASRTFATALVKGESCIVEYYEPVEQAGKGTISMNEFGYVYRAANAFEEQDENSSQLSPAASDPCEVDVKCPEGTAWADQIRGVCRILVKVGTSSGLCSGSAINNTMTDCTPYILTAQHCGVGATTADYNGWKFYFNYQKSGCGSGSGSLSNVLTGASLRANSNDVSGSAINKSDFILCETNSAFPAAFNIYLNGWNRVNTGATSGASIHHPAGDFKKISTFTTTLTTSAWSGSSTHWRVVWAATVTNHGVTEGGSSGSPIFNQSNLIVGQLSGGSSFCTSPTAPDLYGKFSYSWLSCGTTTDRRLSPWLDPAGTGATSLAGMNNLCITGENDIEIENIFVVYPNPVNDVLVIESTGFNETVHTIYVYDQLGKLVTSFEVSPGKFKKSIPVTGFDNGVYNIVITNGERTFNKKFVKM